jgi:hypothetical protein
MPGSAGKKALGGIDGSSIDMGLLASGGGGGSNEQMEFSGVIGAEIVDGEGADDDSAEKDEN